ncbi:putative glutamine amidotransferase [Nocardioides albertanoniae]|uniref:Putative glutamine amidotransferase n=1 Tax=Nocardioides albertanoniae TaxID=1175486 RepID=A0A543A8K0_9ACTN|nr:class II glutamine amidotransferase [Nocardioides albertanoniae]TQL68928.1 putative glutamine amidotransferase [Nocardioides albertanoniae]
MCRLFGYVTKSPCAVADLLGEEGLHAFTSLTTVHSDGWGMAWHTPEGTRTESSPRSADLDESYRRLVEVPLSHAGLVHLRWATGGIDVRPENTHPFLSDDAAFAHNGHITPIADLEALLTAESRARLGGDTDSERYFQFVHQSVEQCGDEAEGVSRALAALVKRFPRCSLNALVLTPTHMFAIHINSRADSPLRALRQLFDDEGDIPPRHTTEYFAMDYRETSRGLEVVSSGLGQPGWMPVPADTAVMVDLPPGRSPTWTPSLGSATTRCETAYGRLLSICCTSAARLVRGGARLLRTRW